MRWFSGLSRGGLLLLAMLATAQALAAESAKSVDDAIAQSKKSGKPIFALLGSET